LRERGTRLRAAPHAGVHLKSRTEEKNQGRGRGGKRGGAITKKKKRGKIILRRLLDENKSEGSEEKEKMPADWRSGRSRKARLDILRGEGESKCFQLSSKQRLWRMQNPLDLQPQKVLHHEKQKNPIIDQNEGICARNRGDGKLP